MTDVQQLISGGYLLGRPSIRGDWHPAQLVPERILSASDCLTDIMPASGDFGPSDLQSEAFAMLHRGLTEPEYQVQAARACLWELLRANLLEFPGIFLSPAAARTFRACPGSNADGTVIFGISTTPAHFKALVEAEGGKTYCYTAVLARNQAPESGEILGWEVLGSDHCGFHS